MSHFNTTPTVPVWEVKPGDVIRHHGEDFKVVKVDADVQRNAGHVALYWLDSQEGRVLFPCDARVWRVAEEMEAQPLAPWAAALLAH